jgi:hypothetical protein
MEDTEVGSRYAANDNQINNKQSWWMAIECKVAMVPAVKLWDNRARAVSPGGGSNLITPTKIDFPCLMLVILTNVMWYAFRTGTQDNLHQTGFPNQYLYINLWKISRIHYWFIKNHFSLTLIQNAQVLLRFWRWSLCYPQQEGYFRWLW